MHQPGEKWMYHTGSDVLGVLITRASGQDFAAFLRERIFAPLGMKDTDFYVAPKQDRLATSYLRDPATNELNVHDDPRASRWGKPPTFASGGGGPVSTVDDYLAFCRMMLGKGIEGQLGHRTFSQCPAPVRTRIIGERNIESCKARHASRQGPRCHI